MSELKVQTWLYVHTFVENHASDPAFLIDTAFRFETSNLCNTLLKIHDFVQRVLQVFFLALICKNMIFWQLFPSLQFLIFCIDKSRLVFLQFQSNSSWHMMSRIILRRKKYFHKTNILGGQDSVQENKNVSLAKLVRLFSSCLVYDLAKALLKSLLPVLIHKIYEGVF